MSRFITGMGSRYTNFKIKTESDFNITPPGISIWTGNFPFKPGDTFPTKEIKDRADMYLTNNMLYHNDFNEIMDTVFSWNDYLQNPITNMPNMAIIANLPDYNVTTESWVELISAEAPSILPVSVSNDEDKDRENSIIKVLEALNNSNFNIEFQDIIRCGYCMYGNKVVRVNRMDNGVVNIIDMPVKCWIPWVNKDDISTIDVNMFFSIFNDGIRDVCQFISYYEDGTIEKRTFGYNNGILGNELCDPEKTKAFNSDVSPIVVFTGDRTGGSVFGNSQYKYWDASISFAIRAYEALGVLIEQMKEIYRVLPDGTTRTDEDSGITYQTNTGAVVYKGDNAPTVEIKKATIALNDAINVYAAALKRVAKDTGLPLSYFDETQLGGKISADALRTTMFRSALKAEKIISLFKSDVKKLVVRMAKAMDLDLNITDFSMDFKTGFINDEELRMKIIQSRTGGAVTMSVADAISAYDGVGVSVAKRKAEELAGIKNNNIDVSIDDTTSGTESVVDNGVNLDNVSEAMDNVDDEIGESVIDIL